MKSKPKSIGIIGYYNQENYGDDLLAYLFYNYVNGISKYNAILFDPSDSLKSTILNGKYFYGNKSLAECSHVIFGGGGVLGELNPRRFGWRIFLSYIKKIRNLKKLNIPYYFICVGVGPIYSIIGKFIVGYMVRNSEFTIVRDRESFNILKSLGIKKRIYEAVDFALSFTPEMIPEYSKNTISRKYEKSSGSILGINLCDFNCHEDAGEQNIDEEIISNLKLIYNKGGFKQIIVIVSMLNGPESIGALKVLQAFPAAELYIHKNIFDTAAVLHNLDFLITQKLHVSIVAYCLKVPTVCIGYHPKIKRFYDQVQAAKYYIPITSKLQVNEKLRLLFSMNTNNHPFVNHDPNTEVYLNKKLKLIDKMVSKTIK